MKLKLEDLKLKSFITDPEKMRAGAALIKLNRDSARNCSPLCMHTELGSCDC
ncbi:MAG: pinensin family lanthipeptide [Acidobacteriota bacterium]|nr:pinensin family lanthipeptide [Acidobacteriota bacterium]